MKQVAAHMVQVEVFSRVMEITAAIRRSLAELTRDEFERLRKAELIPSENLTGLQLLREKAANERNLRELYRDRAPFELIQNADDAGATKAAFVICADGFAFGHNGSWFTVENFRSLAEGWSNKKPGECIGHKGLGFRSVLDVSPSPVLGRIAAREADQFAVKFSWKNNESFVQRVLARTPELKAHYASWIRNGQSACPVMAIPSAVRPDTLGGGTSSWQSLRALGHTTLFWLPAADPDLPASAASHLAVNPITSVSGKDRLLRFLEQEMTVVLPFLRTLKSISVLQGKNMLLEIYLQEEEVQRKASYWCRTSSLRCRGISTTDRRMFQVGTRCSIPPHVKQDPHTPVAARNLADVAVTLAVELVDGEPSPSDVPFYVYFPTEDRTGVGFVVHADFHVEPHRKHLMLGAFNSWIYKEAAKLAAGPFLTELLARFGAKSVFNVQGPVGSPTTFLEMLGNELRERKLPFVPTKDGLVNRDVAVLAPNLYQSAYFEEELAEALASRRPQSRLLSAEVDCARTRAFLELAEIEILDSGSVIELIEDAAQAVGEDTEWWLRAYSHLARDPVVSCYDRDQFIGKRLVPGDADVLPVPAPTDPQLCLPPTRVRTTGVPEVFSSVFRFVNPDLADQLDDTEDSIAAWARDRFAITRFEASELLPRAIRAVNPSLFSHDHVLPREQLVEMWRFVQALATTSRMQSADDVWTSIGRLPLVVESGTELPDVVDTESLAPAFLLYWPDDCVAGEAWIQRLQLPRASSALLLEISGGKMTAEWSSFFHNVGISIAPKLLEYSRVPGLGEVQLSTTLPSSPQYTGERQRDENAAVLRVLRESKWWRNALSSVEQCGHTSTKVLHSIHVIDGLSECSKTACQEHAAGDETWRERLLSLAKRIAPFGAVGKFTDSAYCRGRGGHSLTLTPAVRLQLETTPWLPSSRGPAASMQCFLRQSMHRIISGTSDFGDLNDAILPFVVTDDLNLFSGLARAGIRTLESVRGASPEVLTAAMNEIGAALSTDWGRENVLTVPPRWRAVRGTLQEIFRALNQFEVELVVSARLLPVRTAAGVEFRPAPFWYADPGALRDAFTGVLPLLDADRAYQQTFKAAGVQQLVAGDSVIEELTFSQQPVVSETLRSALVDGVGPYLLAMIASRTDSDEDRELSSKRLRERFSVCITPVIQLAFVLASDESVRVEYSAGKYYLQRRLVTRRGAVGEAQFTLYIAHSGNPLIIELDADAIGMHLAHVLQDRPSAELAASCARIATRFKEVSGDATAMKEFMYNHLQVSIETQDDVVAEALEEDDAPSVPVTPPPIVISGTSTESDEDSPLSELLQRQQARAANEATELVNRIVRPQKTDHARAENTGAHRERSSNGEATESITDEQAERGRRGEEEMKRRLTLPGGWAGFVFREDVRSPGCGYDFVAERLARDIRIEVKTFTANGRIMFTSRELKEAAIDGASYFLVGLLDDGGPEKSWRTYLVQNPLIELLRMGSFTFEARLQLNAEQLCALAR